MPGADRGHTAGQYTPHGQACARIVRATLHNHVNHAGLGMPLAKLRGLAALEVEARLGCAFAKRAALAADVNHTFLRVLPAVHCRLSALDSVTGVKRTGSMCA